MAVNINDITSILDGGDTPNTSNEENVNDITDPQKIEDAEELIDEGEEEYDENGDPIEYDEVDEEEGEEEEELPEADEDSDADDSDQEDESEEQDYFPETLEDLFEAFDGADDKVKSITVAKKKNGDPVSLEQVLANWEISEAATRKSQEATELKRKLEQDSTNFYKNAQSKLDQQESILNALEELWINQGKEELEELRKTNPGEYAARKAELVEQKEQLEVVKGSVTKEREELQKEQAEKYKEFIQEKVSYEQRELLNKIPEWKDEKVYKEEGQKVFDHLLSAGYTKDELSQLSDHRAMILARDAMRYRNLQSKVDTKKKRVVKKPKPIRGSAASAQERKTERIKANRFKRAATSKDNKVKRGAIADLLNMQGIG